MNFCHAARHDKNRNTATAVENTVQIKEGKNVSNAAALPALVLSAITVDGIICIEVAFITNKSFWARSFPSFSSSPMALTAYGVAAPPMPKRLQERFIARFSDAASFSVLKSLRESGFSARAACFESPLFSARRETPIHTAYMQKRVSAIFAERSAPPRREERSLSGAIIAITASEAIKITEKMTFIY